MLDRSLPLAITMEGALGLPFGKMGYGVLRYSPNPIACLIDSTHAGEDHRPLSGIERPCPVVASVREAADLGARVLVLGIAPPGGLIPAEWLPGIDEAVRLGLCVVNGLHDRLAPRYPSLSPGQWIWDIRVEPEGLGVAKAEAAGLANRRVLMIGTDMAVGKMTAGLEMHRAALARGIRAEFVATGQIGITIMGRGVPLDAVRVDYAAGAIEREVMAVRDAELVIVEGQGALIHPGSSANLPLLRGACPTHLVLCHRAGATGLMRLPHIKIPPLRDYLRLYEELSEACGTFPRARACAVALNTAGLSHQAALEAAQAIEDETGLPCVDPLRHGAEPLVDAVLA
ncbi:MAG: DUF1611 domain-containing protein [Fimbriimonas ginsengisoli]|uniref:DUF1611 domain-containing protein n=1 Tax=Fimbriimonas ginsengisoli TaxID=1005039 RepID=A0A931LUS5_FIMGI|nr:DUF1611 domain-containing protein [Fimbriimonas ginsengisoli]MBI3720983.1 DUF1611 domain-containing protein [Fimbriimonas ginsengisoli]